MSHPVDDRRRSLLRAALLSPVVLAVSTGCSDAPGRKAVPLVQPDSDSHVRWRAVRAEQALLARYAATITRHPGLSERLGPIVAQHEDHLSAVVATGPLPIAAEGLSKPGAGKIADDEGKALAAIRDTEDAMSKQHADGCVAASGPTLAALLASLAGSEAGHAAALGA